MTVSVSMISTSYVAEVGTYMVTVGSGTLLKMGIELE
jgi:hypothetical protein